MPNQKITITTVHNQIQNIAALLSKMQTVQETILARQEGFDGSLRATQTSMQGMQATITDVQTTVQGLQTTVHSLQTSVQDLQISALDSQTSVRDLQASFEDLRSSQLETQSSLRILQTSHGALQKSVRTVEARVVFVEYKLDAVLKDHGAILASLRSRVEILHGLAEKLEVRTGRFEQEYLMITAGLRRLEDKFDALEGERLAERIRALESRVAALEAAEL